MIEKTLKNILQTSRLIVSWIFEYSSIGTVVYERQIFPLISTITGICFCNQWKIHRFLLYEFWSLSAPLSYSLSFCITQKHFTQKEWFIDSIENISSTCTNIGSQTTYLYPDSMLSCNRVSFQSNFLKEFQTTESRNIIWNGSIGIW